MKKSKNPARSRNEGTEKDQRTKAPKKIRIGKPRCDSTLDRLARDRKERLEGWLLDENKGYREVRDLMAREWGVQTSHSAVGRYYTQRLVPRQLLEAKEAAVAAKGQSVGPAGAQALLAGVAASSALGASASTNKSTSGDAGGSQDAPAASGETDSRRNEAAGAEAAGLGDPALQGNEAAGAGAGSETRTEAAGNPGSSPAGPANPEVFSAGEQVGEWGNGAEGTGEGDLVRGKQSGH